MKKLCIRTKKFGDWFVCWARLFRLGKICGINLRERGRKDDIREKCGVNDNAVPKIECLLVWTCWTETNIIKLIHNDSRMNNSTYILINTINDVLKMVLYEWRRSKKSMWRLRNLVLHHLCLRLWVTGLNVHNYVVASTLIKTPNMNIVIANIEVKDHVVN